LTPDEKVVQNIAKRARQQEAQDEMTELNWRSIDSKTECFLIDQLPPEKAFLTLNMRRRDASYLDIFRIFFTDSISSRLFESMSPEDTLLGYRKSGTPHHFVMRIAMIWEMIAIQVYVIGHQVKSTENDPLKRGLRKSVNDARSHFIHKLPGVDKITCSDILERLLARSVIYRWIAIT
jgi:hypothetical protein